MNVKVSKIVTVEGKTKRGAEVKVSGSNGMFSLKIGGKAGRVAELDQMLYTDELDDVIAALVEFKKTLETPQQV